MTVEAHSNNRVSADFQKVSGEKPFSKRRTRAFAIRFTEKERGYLEQKAGSLPLGTYIRQKILGDREESRLTLRRPRMGDAKLSTVLAELGASRLASNVNQLAKSANMGTLDVSSDVEQELQDAAEAILAMRSALFVALGLKP